MEAVAELVLWAGSLTTSPMPFEQYLELTQRLPNHKIEQEPDGQVNIMPPTFSGSGSREIAANAPLWFWNRQTNLGKIYGPSTGIKLPDGSTKQADAAWVSNEKLARLNAAQLDSSFLPLAPDFVIEVRSETDKLEVVQAKMTNAWIANGVRLAWLIDPYEEKAWIYRENGSAEMLQGFDNQKLSGENVLPGFELELSEFKIPE